MRFELFGEGRDAGIDMRSQGPDGVVVGQAKRYSSWANLKPVFRQERTKLDKLNPARYLLLTSCSLSPGNKDELFGFLGPHCLSLADIYGRDDLDAALARQPQVLKRHFKLWLQDAEQIRAVLHNGVLQLSGAQLESMVDELRYFVVHPFVERALDYLDRQHICLITGDAGVGKSVLCGYLALQMAARDGYEVHMLRDIEGIEGAWELLQPGRKQCLVLDDLLGATFLDTQAALALEHALVNLLNKAKKSQGQLKLLIASRGYVLKQAAERLPKLARWLSTEPENRLDYAEVPLRTKADILFNLIYFCGLTDEQKHHLVTTESYWSIIHHQHFNPRLLENILRDDRQGTPEELPSWLIRQLDDPTQYWETTFQRLSPEAQCLLYTLAVGGGDLEEADLSVSDPLSPFFPGDQIHG